MTGTPGPQTLDSIIAFWICIPIATLAGLAMIGGIIAAIGEKYDRTGPVAFAITGGVVAALFVGGYIAGMYPDDFAHHHYTRYSGVVATTDSRLIASGTDGGGSDQKFVVTFTAAPNEPFGVLDTRAAVVRPGQTLTIDCVQQWQYAGTDGQDCAFVALG